MTIKMARIPTSRQLMALLLTLFAGCGNMPERDLQQIPTPELYEQAQDYESRGNLLAAALNYQQLAERNAAPGREEHLLEAANLLSRGQHSDRALAIIATIDSKRLSSDQSLRLRLIQARIAMSDKQPRRALEQLELPTTLTPPANLQREWRALEVDAYTLTSNHFEATRSRIALEPLLSDESAIEENRRQLWQELNLLSEAALQVLRKQPPPDVLSGWLELAIVAKQLASKPTQLNQQLSLWRQRYPNHPAPNSLIDELRSVSQATVSKLPLNIALLLPLSGGFSSQAIAVRDGFLGAYYSHTSSDYTPLLRIYDTTDNVDAGMAVYHQAVEEGADFIIGPLHKPLLERIASEGDIPIPTLALNYLNDENTAVNNLYQYGLLPEDEARQVAERAWLDGHSRALALIPTGEWGDRMLATFSKEWQQLNGQLLEVQRYDASQHDFSAPLTQLLDINLSRARFAALKSTLGLDIKFDGRRRQDADFIFVAAFPNQARQIRPQLRFYYAGDLPVYSTSHTYTGEVSANQDRDLEGILFCDMPWTLIDSEGSKPNWREFTKAWKSSVVPFKRLYAMGIDAYSLMEHFDTISGDQQSGLSAQSGNLYRDAANRIHRQLLWAQFRRGKPVVIDNASAPQQESL